MSSSRRPCNRIEEVGFATPLKPVAKTIHQCVNGTPRSCSHERAGAAVTPWPPTSSLPSGGALLSSSSSFASVSAIQAAREAPSAPGQGKAYRVRHCAAAAPQRRSTRVILCIALPLQVASRTGFNHAHFGARTENVFVVEVGASRSRGTRVVAITAMRSLSFRAAYSASGRPRGDVRVIDTSASACSLLGDHRLSRMALEEPQGTRRPIRRTPATRFNRVPSGPSRASIGSPRIG